MIPTKFKAWYMSLTMDNKRHIAFVADTSVATLNQLASGHRNASSELAARVETASGCVVLRGDLNETCAQCPFYKQPK